MKPILSPRAIRRLILQILLLVVGILNVYPFIWMISNSLKDLPQFALGTLNLIPKKWFFQNYTTAWTEAEFGRYLFNTLVVAVVPTVSSLLSCCMAGYALARKSFIGRRIYLGVAVVMMFIPGGYTMIPLFKIIYRLHLVGSMLGVILPGLGGGLMQTLFFYGFYSSISTGVKELEDATVIDGANLYQSFGYVMLPMARPMFATLGIMGFIGGWNSFLWPMIVSLGRPKLQTITVGLFSFKGEHLTEWTLLLAGTTMGLMPIIIVFFFAQRWIIEGLSGMTKM